METIEIAAFYQRDIHRVIDEINLFKDESNLWKTCGSINNSSGNLVLHLLGGLNFLIGTNLGSTNYIRNRELEFKLKDVDKEGLVQRLKDLSSMIDKTLTSLSNEKLKDTFPIFVDKENSTISYVLVQLLLHLNYHLGQISYLRRTLE